MADALQVVGAVQLGGLVELFGIDFNPAASMSIQNGKPFQTLTKMSDASAVFGSPSQSLGSTPTWARIEFASPPMGLRIVSQTALTTTPGITQGMSSRVRDRGRRSCPSRLRVRAATKPMMAWKTRQPKVQMNVVRSGPPKSPNSKRSR